MSYLTTLSIVLCLAISGQAIADNANAFQTALEATRRVNTLVLNGATDSDCQEIEAIMGKLASLRPLLTEAQQRVIWEHSPYWAGIACAWPVGQVWQGNDCEFQCGNLEECQGKDGNK
jgi:hypothetical protein